MDRGARLKLRGLKPSQRVKLARWAGCCRKAYNLALDEDLGRMSSGLNRWSYTAHANGLPTLKRTPELAYLAEAPSQALQQALMDLDRAWDRHFTEGAGEPTFRKKGVDDTMRFPQGFQIDAVNGRVRLPKLGWVRVFNKGRLAEMETRGRATSVTVKREADDWWLSIHYDIPDPVPTADLSAQVGIDMGVAHAMALSDGTFCDMDDRQKAKVARMEEHVERLQRKASKQRKGSRNQKKTYRKVAKLRRRAADARRDFRAKATTDIAKSHGLVVVEDLDVEGMTKSAKGTVEEPGSNVRQKAGLNRAILEVGWGDTRRMLKYKLEERGGELVAVNPAFTSQRCSKCGHVSPDNRKTQSEFHCVRCGHTENADTNAAKNILAAGRAAAACGEGTSAPSEKQEPREAA